MGRATASRAEGDAGPLEELEFHWGSAYHLAVIDGMCTAWRKDGRGGTLKPEDLDRARAAVAAWRDQNPAGTAGQLTAALGPGFHPDYGPVLRAVLFAVDRHRARGITGIPACPDVTR